MAIVFSGHSPSLSQPHLKKIIPIDPLLNWKSQIIIPMRRENVVFNVVACEKYR